MYTLGSSFENCQVRFFSRGQVIEHTDRFPAIQELLRNMRTDKACTTGNQIFCSLHSLPLPHAHPREEYSGNIIHDHTNKQALH